MKLSLRSLRLVPAISMALWVITAWANIPPNITSFQGVLRDATEQPLSGTYPIVFRYWSDASSVDAATFEIGWESHPAVIVNDGLFTALLGTQPFNTGASGYGGLNINQMFGDFNQVWLQLEVDGDVLLPRIQFAAAPWAFNCTQLQDKSPGEFLRSEGSDNFTGSDLYGYSLTLDPPTTLNVGGALQLAGVSMTSSAAELNRLDGVGVSVTPANLTTLTNGGVANALHVHTNVDAAKLGGADGSQFLRSDVSDSFTAGTLSTATGTTLSISGDLVINSGNTFPRVYFASGEVPRPELRYNTHGAGFADDQFEFTHRLNVAGLLHAGPLANQAPQRAYHFLGDYVNGVSASGYITDDSDLLVIDDIAAGERVYAGTQLHVASGNSVARTYSAFGSGTPHSSDMTTGDDVHISADLEIEGSLYATSGVIAGDVSPTTGQVFNSFGEAAGQDAAEIDSLADVYIAQDLEVDGSVNAPTVTGPAGTRLYLQADGEVRTMFDGNDNSSLTVADWYHDGVVSNANKLAELQEDGDFRIRGALSQNVAFDLAESFWASEPIAVGEIVSADPLNPGAVRRTSGNHDALVLGIVSARPGMLLGSAPFDEAALASTWGEAARGVFASERESLAAAIVARHAELQSADVDVARLESLALELFFERHVVPVALAGRVRVKVETNRGAIRVGDPLAPGPTPGTAARAQVGDSIVAIALEPLASGHGEVLAFVQRGGLTVTAPSAPLSNSALREVPALSEPAVSPRVAAIEAPAGSGPMPVTPAASFLAIGPIGIGDLVRIDSDQPGAVQVTDSALDRRVVGIVIAVDEVARTVSVALGGVVSCKVDASEGSIEPGDLLASSPLRGHANRAVVSLPGTIVGKALQRHQSGTGTISVLVQSR